MANKKLLKIFIVAGEESGDLHGSKLVHAMKKHTKNIQFTGHGGDRMANENSKLWDQQLIGCEKTTRIV